MLLTSFPVSAMPLVLIKKFQRGKPADKYEVNAEENGDSDFEEIHETV